MNGCKPMWKGSWDMEERKKKRKRSLLSCKAVSLILAAATLFSIIAVIPDEAKSAEYSFGGTGITEITITDDACRQASKNKEFHWIRFQPKKTGSITIAASNASSVAKDTYGNIVLCNASKKVIDNTADRYETAGNEARRTVTYGVKAGSAYYFRVESSGGVKLRAAVSAVKKNAGKTFKKAKLLAHGKTVKGVVVAGDKTADWYKINLTKSKKIEITCSAKTNGWNGTNVADGIRVTFCDSTGTMFTKNAFGILSRNQIQYKMTYFLKAPGSKKKYNLKRGVYYIRVERFNKASSGEYTVKWNMI